MAKNGGSQLVAEAVQRLKDFVEEKEGMEVEFTAPLTEKEVTALEAKYSLKLPPSYVDFLCTHGAFKVLYGGAGLIGMEDPKLLRAAAPDPSDAQEGDDPEVEAAINEALFFQRIDDDEVENFWCFNPRDRNEQDELGVVAYQHDETFGLPKLLGTRHAEHFRDFSAHIVDVINEFVETYAEA